MMPEPGEMSAIDRAFYDYTVSQRDRAWEECERLREEVSRLRSEVSRLQSEYRRLQELSGQAIVRIRTQR